MKTEVIILAGLIDKAIPTEKKAMEYLKINNLGEINFAITASLAREIFPNYNNKSFFCATNRMRCANNLSVFRSFK